MLYRPDGHGAAPATGKWTRGNEAGYSGGWGLVVRDLLERLSEAGTVALAVGGTTEFRVPKEPKRTDFFSAKQTGQAFGLAILVVLPLC
jgi:hypothetical protein